MSFPDSDSIAKIEQQYLDSQDSEHHPYCPMAVRQHSSLCLCAELYKADKMAADEERYEESRKYGER